MSIWDTQNNSKGQITNSRQSVDKPPPLQHLLWVSAQFPLPRARRTADAAPSHAGRGERGQLPLEQPRAGSPRPVGYRGRAPLRVPEAGWPGRPRAFSASAGQKEASGGGRGLASRPSGPRAASAGRRGEAGRGRGAEGGGRCILGNPPTWGEAATAAAVSPGRGCRRFPDAQLGPRGAPRPGFPWQRPASAPSARPPARAMWGGSSLRRRLLLFLPPPPPSPPAPLTLGPRGAPTAARPPYATPTMDRNYATSGFADLPPPPAPPAAPATASAAAPPPAPAWAYEPRAAAASSSCSSGSSPSLKAR